MKKENQIRGLASLLAAVRSLNDEEYSEALRSTVLELKESQREKAAAMMKKNWGGESKSYHHGTPKGYYYRKLPTDLQKGYDMAAEGIAGYQKKIRIPGISCKEEMEWIIHAILLEQLQFFYFNKREIGIIQAGDQYSFAFAYLYDKKKSAQLQEQIEIPLLEKL